MTSAVSDQSQFTLHIRRSGVDLAQTRGKIWREVITPCCFDHIRNYKCPNDSRPIMPFVASVSSFLAPRRKKVCLENSSIVCRVPL